MSDQKTGYCLPLYLKNRLVLSALEDEDALPQDVSEDRQQLAQFHERASEQAVSLLEELYLSMFGGTTTVVPYRSDRRTQRRTVREHWYVSGRLYRKHERTARAGWDIFLACLRDKGPAVTLVLASLETTSAAEFDDLSTAVAPTLGLDSANARQCFTHNAGYDLGTVAAFAPLGAGTPYKELLKQLKAQADGFFTKFKSQFEAAVDA